MTGWKSVEETLPVVSQIMARRDLLADSWYHISLHMDMEVDKVEKENSGYFQKESLDLETIKWYKSDPDRLKERIEWLKKIQLSYFEAIRILSEELDKLS